MANICDQNLYIVAATANDMRTLLLKMATTFEKATNLNLLSSVDASADWKVLADAMESGSYGYNMLCFLAEEPDTRSESGNFRGDLVAGKPYIVLSMGLKWGPSYQVAEFCDSLDSTKYGFACINGGEYMCAMGDEIAYIQWGEDSGGPHDGGLEYEEYVQWANEVKGKTPTTLDETALRQLFTGEGPGTYFWEHEDDGYGTVSPFDFLGGCATINWQNPSKMDLQTVGDFVVGALEKFPWVIGVTGSAYEGREANVEDLVPGSLVKLVSDWNTPYFNPVGIAVYTADDRRIGNLDNVWSVGMSLEDTDRTAIACILPHIRAYAEQVQPLSTKDGRSRHSTVTIRLEVNDRPLEGVFDEVQSLLSRRLGKRELTSDLEGAM